MVMVMAGGKSDSPQTVDIYSQSNCIIVVKDSKQSVDLADHGNRTPGTPVILGGEHQVWIFKETR